MSKTKIKWTISIIAIILCIAHFVFPKINIDLITVLLLALAVIPWVEGLFKSVELPGGLKLEFQDLERIGFEAKEAGIIKEYPDDTSEVIGKDEDYAFVELAKTNQSLALVSLRIEIEKRLREIAKDHRIDFRRSSMSRILNRLAHLEVLSPQENATLLDMIHTLNQAAHGVEFDQRTAEWIIDNGPQIIYSLDSKIYGRGGKFSHENPDSIKHWIDLSFEKHNWKTNVEWEQHISKHLDLWRKEIEKLKNSIVSQLEGDENKFVKFRKADENWDGQLELEREFLASMSDLSWKIGREGQMIMATTFMNKHRDRALELEEILRLIKE